MIYGEKELQNFTKELNAFYKAKSDLKTKIINYLDSLDEEIEICVNIGGGEIVFVKIGKGVFVDEDGFELHYEFFTVEELIDVLEDIVKYHDEQMQKRLEE